MAEIDLRDQNNNNVRDMLPHKPMRLSMENKNLLSKKGDIYVGTGGTQTVTIEDDTYIIAKTAKVSVPSEVISSNESAILIYDKTNNLQYKKSSKSGFVTYGVEQSLTDEQKSTARNNIGAAAVSDLTFLSYKVDQTEIIVDPSGQESGPKTRLLKNIFNGLTGSQKDYVRSQIDAGSAQGVAGITAGDGIKVDSSTTQSYPKVSVNLATNSGLVCDSSSSGKLKLNVNSKSQDGNKYWVQIDNNNYPYVNVPMQSSDNQKIVYASNTTSSADIVGFGSNATVKLVPGDNISMTASTTNNYIQINATDTQYSAAERGGIKLNGTSFSLNTGTITGEKKYAVQLENGIPYVNVPWMNTTYTGSNGISVSNEAISVNLAENSGLVFDDSSPKKLKLKIGNVTGEKNYAVKLQNGIPYVNVPWMNTTYTGGNGISVANGTISLAEGYNVPIEYQPSASSTAGFTSNKLYLIGTWTGV